MGFRDLLESFNLERLGHDRTRTSTGQRGQDSFEQGIFGAGSGDQAAYDVFVAARPFTDFGGALLKRMSPDAKAMMVELGVCHYMTILRCPKTGKLTQFDFGPVGGDIHVPLAATAQLPVQPAADAQAPQPPAQQQRRRSKAVPGESRVRRLDALPDIHMQVGTTQLTLKEIEQWSQTFGNTYHLNVSDCRHYTNQLVRKATGMDSAAAHLVRHHHTSRRQQNPRLFDHVLPAIQTMTNVDNWPAVQMSAYVTGAAAVAAVGHPLAHPVASTVVAMTVLSRRHAATALQRVTQLKPAFVRARQVTETSLPRLTHAPARLTGTPHSSTAVHKLKHGFASCTHSLVGASSSALRRVARRGSNMQTHALPHGASSGVASAFAPASAVASKLQPIQAGFAQAAGHVPATASHAISTIKSAVSAQKGNVPRLISAASSMRPTRSLW